MNVDKTSIDGVLIITPGVFKDDRGFFMETYNKNKFDEIGITENFHQDNHSCSSKNTLRGLHFQTTPGQSKLLRCIRGTVFDVAVDIRIDSPTFGKWAAVELSDENKKMFYMPVGIAHGFCVLSDMAEVVYKVSNVYNAETEAGIAWNDPDINIDWPTKAPILSDRDKNNQSLAEYAAAMRKL
ncbi:MAG: dTDP-4-dehydrorhamnose 3,5-epimerase [Spirochaetes bacterium]|nr:dTDP-4-dehydrorhamnose 3,5-epimerase [Spirochaetota bacterium]